MDHPPTATVPMTRRRVPESSVVRSAHTPKRLCSRCVPTGVAGAPVARRRGARARTGCGVRAVRWVCECARVFAVFPHYASKARRGTFFSRTLGAAREQHSPRAVQPLAAAGSGDGVASCYIQYTILLKYYYFVVIIIVVSVFPPSALFFFIINFLSQRRRLLARAYVLYYNIKQAGADFLPNARVRACHAVQHSRYARHLNVYEIFIGTYLHYITRHAVQYYLYSPTLFARPFVPSPFPPDRRGRTGSRNDGVKLNTIRSSATLPKPFSQPPPKGTAIAP